ncbi:CheR family methyltransferase [Cohnella silvisoli]|uniref:Protein-glutamate O-methyltransferase CheR n=1 Tax=Cohnella silvisoli TaxID=2873699 RepID=A0ABV1L303_9BACL|nr:protein-glutamate O-methyltransferase CheR [Cohnella silvisoli]MCD9025977.1 protein-glutamate O-methyltransferase CheR [Cohnella silvisoli]
MITHGPSDGGLEKIEIALLLEGIYRRYGYDFRNYAFASIRRRIWHRIQMEGLSTVSSLQERVMHHTEAFHRLIGDLVIPVTEMFRDPDTFLALRRDVIPLLRKLPYIRIWHAGCSTGEEVHSMSILLHEEGVLDKTRIYATDINESALQKAKEGIIPLEKMKQYTKNYQAAGGMQSFSDYYDSDQGIVRLKPFLRRNIVIARHNLVTDRSFNEFHVIMCRNVMIYFNSQLRSQVHKLLYDSLAREGFLVVGGKESISFTPLAERYETRNDQHRIFRKLR